MQFDYITEDEARAAHERIVKLLQKNDIPCNTEDGSGGYVSYYPVAEYKEV